MSRASESVLRVARLLRVRLPRRALGVGGEEVHRDLVLGAEGGSFEGGSFEGSARHLERGFALADGDEPRSEAQARVEFASRERVDARSRPGDSARVRVRGGDGEAEVHERLREASARSSLRGVARRGVLAQALAARGSYVSATARCARALAHAALASSCPRARRRWRSARSPARQRGGSRGAPRGGPRARTRRRLARTRPRRASRACARAPPRAFAAPSGGREGAAPTPRTTRGETDARAASTTTTWRARGGTRRPRGVTTTEGDGRRVVVGRNDERETTITGSRNACRNVVVGST